ncbi:hypothetical protein K7X08_033379 [Anisodus acutangulus]|uniref:non-specific serine/threonine protein kinase n=1 Tax=Anisodus acutangulus TaxID=402998 RepID=A0A9Q1M330_9SOLA|nr:hypothetical protein K7X08_033379 [Anisodus acutangulus]
MSAILSWLFTICHLCISITLYASCVASNDTLFPNQVLLDGQTLVSSKQRFEMGFFDTTYAICRRYLGLWYKNIGPSVVWVGNRLNPLGCGAMLVLHEEGHIFLQDLMGTTVSIYKPNQNVPRPVLQLLDSGNLVFGDSSNLTAGEYLWQSFDYPVDTLLPGMKLGWDHNRAMNSWRTSVDPGLGEYLFKLESSDSGQSPQLVLEKNHQRDSRWGPWDGQKFSGSDVLMDNEDFRPILNSNTDAFYFTFEAKNDWSLKLSLNPDGKTQFLRWNNATKCWDGVKILNKDTCDQYRTCGSYGFCFVEDPSCLCPDGFTDASPDDSEKMNFTEACRRITPLNYTDKDVFVKNSGLKLPDNATYWGMLYHKKCGERCLNERSCMAYSNIKINGNGSKCLVCLGDLLDMRRSHKAGNDIFIRMAHGKLDPARSGTVTWSTRFTIIKGITKGLVYLNHDSRLTILHRDLKASNVLLDREMTPKISDFGLSRVFKDDVEEKTQYVVGTRGYMPPEYIENGHYSTKSDVFSFGILTLEIVSGQRNWGYRHPIYDIGLVGYAWRIWNEGKAIELLDPMIEKPGDLNEVLECVFVGLRCSQLVPKTDLQWFRSFRYWS